MSKQFKAVIIFCSIFMIVGTAFATKLKSSWKNPSATSADMQFKKVLVAVVIRQPMTRKVAEDKAVRVIDAGGRTQAVASYTIFEDLDVDKDQAKAKVEDMGFDGAILIRYADSGEKDKYDPKAAESWNDYNYFWGIWGGTYNAQFRDDQVVYLETLLYSLKENKVLWAGITETKNPKNPAVVVGEIAEEVTKDMQKQGLIPKK